MPDQSDTPGQEGQDPAAQTRAFVVQLDDEERMLVLLQSELYDGSWEAMLADLGNRLEGKPYIFKLANRIRDDIARIEKLKNYEEKHLVKLADFIEKPTPESNDHGESTSETS